MGEVPMYSPLRSNKSVAISWESERERETDPTSGPDGFARG